MTSDESTPLLAGTQIHQDEEPRLLCNPSLWIMGIVFILGVSIGGYLLYEQAQEFPTTQPFFLVHRNKWGANTEFPSGPLFPENEMPLYYILVMQVSNQTCWSIPGCSKVVRDIQNCDKKGDVPFNFLVAGDGNTYEGQGWRHQSLLNGTLPEPVGSKPYLVFAFIGNFTSSLPNSNQLGEAKSLIGESILRSRLQDQYVVLGLRNLTRSSNDGERLFKEVGKWLNFNSTIGAYL